MADIDPVGDSAIAAEKPSALTNPRTRRIVLGGGLLLLLVGIAWLVRYQLVGKYIEGTNNAYIQADAVTVASKVAGYVDAVLVADNQVVKAGQPLLRIDPRDYRAQSAQYQAQSAMADAEAEGIRARIAKQEADVASARATLAAAERRIATLEAQIAEARARGTASRAQLAAADVNLRSTLIRASIAGRIGNKTVRVGQFVQPGMRLMSVVPNQIYIAANFKETQVGLMRIGQPVSIAVDALPGVELRGRVDSLSPGTGAQFSLLPPQNATGNFTKIVQRVPVRISVLAGPETRALLVPGMSVEVKVDTRSARDSRDRIEREQEALDRANP